MNKKIKNKGKKPPVVLTHEQINLYNVLKKSFLVLDLENPVPLKKKITRDLVEFTGLHGLEAYYFLEWYRNRQDYLRCIKTGRNVYDLHGLIVGKVTLEEEQKVQDLIKKKKKWFYY